MSAAPRTTTRRLASATYALLALSTVALGATWRYRAELRPVPNEAQHSAEHDVVAAERENSHSGDLSSSADLRGLNFVLPNDAEEDRYLAVTRDFASSREGSITGIRIRAGSTGDALGFPRPSPSSMATSDPSLVVDTPFAQVVPAGGTPIPEPAGIAPTARWEGPLLPEFPDAATEPKLDRVPPAASPQAFDLPTSATPQGSPFVASAPIVGAVPTRDAAQVLALPPAAAPPVAESVASQLPPTPGPTAPPPPNPWSHFLAGPGPGGFARHGTVTLEEVRVAALRNNPDIAVLGHVPRINATEILGAESVFDPVVNLAASGGHYDRQTSTQIQSLGTSVPVLKTTFWQPITSPNQFWVDKQFVTGGRVVAGIGQNYLNYSPAGSFVFVNPAHQASLNLSLEQPLFRGRGRAATTAGIQIARANEQQSLHAFRAAVNAVLRDAETTYWETYAAFQKYEVRDVALAQASETAARERERMRIGEGSLPDVAQAEEQVETFRIERSAAEAELVAAQRALRRVMGLPSDDPRPLIPATAPVDVPFVLDAEQSAAEALRRPEVAAQQAAVAAAESELRRRRNGLLPDVSLRGLYSVSGLDRQFDGAWSSLGSWNYNDWTAGVVYRQPLGRRSDRALAQRAVETLSMETARLRQLEHALRHELASACERVAATERLLAMHRRRREAAAVTLDARRELYVENRALLRDQLDAEERYAAAMLDEALAKIDYQRALVQWNFARGGMEEDVVLRDD